MSSMLTEKQFLNAYCYLNGLDDFDANKWNSFVRVLRENSLVASFYHRLERSNQLYCIPEYCEDMFLSAINFANAQVIQTEVQGKKLIRLFNAIDIPFVFLKGAAYIIGSKRNSMGRLMTDIDICVEKENIDKAEEALLGAGWSFKNMDEHDDKYYREWSHEIPPLKHDNEGVVLDVHHTLIPPIKGRLLDIHALIHSSESDSDFSSTIPSRAWLVLHSALHLILNEDVKNGLRDLTDIFVLLYGEGSASENVAETEALFIKEGFEQEWIVLSLLLDDFFNTEIGSEHSSANLSLYIRMRHFILRKAIVPNSSFIQSDGRWLWDSVNYVLGYCSKMPLHILFKQVTYKTYRNLIKLAFGEYFFRKPKPKRNGL